MLKLRTMLLRVLPWIAVSVVLAAPERAQFVEGFDALPGVASLHATIESSLATSLSAALDLGIATDDVDDSPDGASPSSQTVTLADVLRLRSEVATWRGGVRGFVWGAIQERGPPAA